MFSPLALVSVIIPNYNHSKYLQQRIDSVLNQSFQDFELIILDDCSTDDSKQRIESYRRHPKLSQIVYNDQNSGSTFLQWDKGLRLAKGDYIWIAESDDLVELNFLHEAINVLKTNDKIGIFQSGSYLIDKDSKIIGQTSITTNVALISGQDFIYQNLLTINSIPNASAVVFRKSSIELPLEKEITDLKYCGDWMLWSKILLKSDIYIFPELLNFFRRHENNVSTFSEKKGLFHLEGIEIYGFIRNNLKSRFKKPFNKSTRFWAYSIISANYGMNIQISYLYKAIKINPIIILLFMYYKVKSFIMFLLKPWIFQS